MRVEKLRGAAGSADGIAELPRAEHSRADWGIPLVRDGADTTLAIRARVIVAKCVIETAKRSAQHGLVVAENVPGHADSGREHGPASRVERRERGGIGKLRRLASHGWKASG